MCNLYSVTKGQAAIREFMRAVRDCTGNLPSMPGVFPDYSAPIVRTAPDGVRELALARWGMPTPQNILMEAAKKKKAAKPRTVHTMNHSVRRFRSLAVALKELERFVRAGKPLQSGRPFKNFGKMLPREAWANWLLCAVVNAQVGAEHFTFTSDPAGGDGIIADTATGETWPTEHVMAPQARGTAKPDVEAAIVKAIADKQKKGGAAYASGKTLIVFSDVGGDVLWYPNKVAKQMPVADFAAFFVVSLNRVEDGQYVYSVSELNPANGTATAWLVRIGKDFDSWTVERIQ